MARSSKASKKSRPPFGKRGAASGPPRLRRRRPRARSLSIISATGAPLSEATSPLGSRCTALSSVPEAVPRAQM
eukprot:11193249-Lingulodinium_polyedra.AAC.1